jgi:outer membrane receptor protein involved in Fe transport
MDDPAVVKYIANGNFLPNSPEHQFSADVEYSLLPQLAVGLSVESLSKWYIDGANIESEAANGYTLLHIRARYGFNIGGIRAELSLFVRNVADKEYIAFTEPDPGGNAYQAGVRREGFVSLRFRI